MDEHHPTLPPSAAPAIMKCPCYQPGKGGKAADKGTQQHDYLKALLSGNPDRSMVLGLEADEVGLPPREVCRGQASQGDEDSEGGKTRGVSGSLATGGESSRAATGSRCARFTPVPRNAVGSVILQSEGLAWTLQGQGN